MVPVPNDERSSDRATTTPTMGGPLARVIQLALSGVIGMAFVGYFVGIRQGVGDPEPAPLRRTPVEPHPEAVLATPYRDFDRRDSGPNRDWRSSLASLAQPKIDLFSPPPERTEPGRLEALAARAERRAFDGAPPLIPHPADQMSSASCLVCHGDGISIGKGVRATKMSHPFLANCTQCHVERQSTQFASGPPASNDFQPFAKTLGGTRAWPGAPPTVPHPVFMREKCLSCHGPTGSDPIRTTHPFRTSCLQCHAPSAVLDQFVDDRSSQFIPGHDLDSPDREER